MRRDKLAGDLAHGAAGEKIQLRDLITKVMQQLTALIPVRVHPGSGSIRVRVLL